MIEHYPITDRAAWLAQRMGDLTCSDTGAVLGLDPHRTALRVYGEKAGQIAADAENKIMRRGRWLESAGEVALQEKFLTWDIVNPQIYLRDPDCRLGGTPDRIAEDPDDPGLINCQIKVVSRPIFERDWADGPPMNYVLQTLGEGYLLDAKRSIIAALVIDTFSADMQVFDVPRHPEAERKICEVARQFWQNIDNGVRPAPDYKHDAETIAALYPEQVRGVAIDLTGDNRLPEILRERARLKAEIETNQGRINEIETEIKDKLGEAETGDLPGWKLTWKLQNRKEYTVAATSFRRLYIKDMSDNGEAA